LQFIKLSTKSLKPGISSPSFVKNEDEITGEDKEVPTISLWKLFPLKLVITGVSLPILDLFLQTFEDFSYKPTGLQRPTPEKLGCL